MKSTVFVALLLTTVLSLQAQEKESPKTFEVYKSDADWKKQLSGMEYYVLRRGGTEYAFTSELLDENARVPTCVRPAKIPCFDQNTSTTPTAAGPLLTGPLRGHWSMMSITRSDTNAQKKNVVNAGHTWATFLTTAPGLLQAKDTASTEWH